MKVNTTIDNSNPAITYLPAADWAVGNKDDPQWTQYYLGTYTMCSKLGDNATFSFFGTGVWVYGALRSNHGLYNITLDGTTTTQDGFAAGTGLYQQVLFGASDLDLGQHTITITNNRNSTTYANLDIDFITFEESVGDGNDTLGAVTDDDNAATFEYGPAATAWSTVPADPTQYHGQTGHTTVTPGAFVTYHFTGSSVSIYGPLGPSQGPYSVSVDGGAEVNYTAAATTLQPQQLLYHGFFDGNNTHSIQITNRPATTGQALDIDYAQVNFAQVPIVTTTSTSATSTSATSSTSIDTSTDLPTVSSTPEPEKKGVSTGVVVAAVVGGLALIAMLSFALMMYRRRKQSRKDEDEPDMITVYPEPYNIGDNGSGPGRYIPPSQYMHDGYNPLDSGGPTPLYPPTPRGPFDQQPFPIAGRQPGDQISIFSGAAPGMPRQVNNRPRFDSSSTGHGYTDVASTAPYGASTAPYGRDSAYTGVSDGSSRIPAHGHSTITGGGPNYDAPLPPVPPLPTDFQRYSNPPLGLHQPPPAPPGIIPPTKGRRVSLPSSATQDLSAVGRDELAANRMRVEGREQDFGPIALEGSDPLTDHPLPLPPNYAQATETYKR